MVRFMKEREDGTWESVPPGWWYLHRYAIMDVFALVSAGILVLFGLAALEVFVRGLNCLGL